MPDGFKLLATLPGNGAILTAVAWSPDGGRIAASHNDTGPISEGQKEKYDCDIFVWDFDHQKHQQTLKGHVSDITHIAFLDTGSLISVARNEVWIWDIDTGKPLGELKKNGRDSGPSPYYMISKLSDDIVAFALGNGNIEIWNLSTRSYQVLKSKGAAYFCLVAAANNGPIIAGGKKRGNAISLKREKLRIDLWDRATRKQVGVIARENVGRTQSLAYIPETQTIIVGCMDGAIRLFELSSGKLLRDLYGHANPVMSIALSSNGRMLASKSLDDTVRLWRVDTWETIAILPEKSGRYLFPRLAFHPTKPDILATFGDQDTSVRIWQLELVI